MNQSKNLISEFGQLEKLNILILIELKSILTEIDVLAFTQEIQANEF